MAENKQRWVLLGAVGLTILIISGWIFVTEWSYQRVERDRLPTESVTPEPMNGEGEELSEESAAPEDGAAEHSYPYRALWETDQIQILDAAGQWVESIPIRPALFNAQDLIQLQQGILLQSEQEYIRFLESFSD